MFFDDIKVLRYLSLDFICAGVDNAAHDIDRVVLHEAADALRQKDDRVGDDVRQNDIELSLDLLGEAAADRRKAVGNSVELSVFGCRAHGGLVDVNACRL